MKILFSGNNFIGSNLRIKNLINKDYKILSYYQDNYITNIDWNTQALKVNAKRYFKDKISPKCNEYYIELILDELKIWGVDLIVSDLEPISAYIAKELGVKLWYVSPLVALFEEHSKLPGYLRVFQQEIKKYPIADRYIIYYPIKISNSLTHIINNNSYDLNSNYGLEINSGETDFISGSLFNNKNVGIYPKKKDLESMFNCYMSDIYGYGVNLGFENSSKEFIENQLSRAFRKNTLIKQTFADII